MRLRKGVAVTPLGMDRTRESRLRAAQDIAGFGRNPALLCPHYVRDEGRCGIWPHRNAARAAFYCKHVRGAVGRRFWDALYQLLSAIERALATWCALQLNVASETLERATDLDDTLDASTYLQLWGEWRGRESEYFIECARRVNALTWADGQVIGGPDIAILARHARAAHRLLVSPETPQRLVVNRLHVYRIAKTGVHVCAEGEIELLELPQMLMDQPGRPRTAAASQARIPVGPGDLQSPSRSLR